MLNTNVANDGGGQLPGPPKGLVRRRGGLIRGYPDSELPSYWTDEEIKKILEAMPAPHRLAFETLWRTGVRVGELRLLTFQSIDFSARAVRVPTLKRRRPLTRVVPLDSELLGRFADALRGAMSAAGGGMGGVIDRPIFAITRQRLGQVLRKGCLRAGVEAGRVHRFRHSFAVHATKNGVPPFVLAEWLGHASVESTLVYAKILVRDSREFYDRIRW